MDEHDGYLPLCSLAGAMAYWRSRKADSKKRIVAVCAVCALVPVLNSAFYALNSSYYARWYYMPSLILAAMTVNALEDPDVDLDAPARGIGWIMLATLVFAVVPVRDDTTGTWSFGVLKNPEQFFVVLGFGLLGLMLYRYLCGIWRQNSRFAQRMTRRCWCLPACSAWCTSALASSASGTPTATLWNRIPTPCS